MKKTLAMLLALIMAMTCLTACSNTTPGDTTTEAPKQTEAQTSGQSGETEAQPTEPAGKAPEDYVGKLKVWSVWGIDAEAALWVDKFNEVYPNIEIEIMKFSNSGDGNIQLETAMIAGEADVVMNFGVNRIVARGEAGMLYDLTEFLEADGLDSVEEWGLEDKVGDQIVSIPMGGLGEHVIINKDMWDAAGLGEIPTEWTLDEYYEAARKMTKYAADGSVEVYGCSNYSTVAAWYYPVVGYLGDDYFYNDEGMASVDEPVWREVFEKMYNAEVVEKIQYSMVDYRDNSINSYTTFHEEKVAMSTMLNAITRRIINTDEYDFDFEITYAPMPTVYENQEHNYRSGLYYFTHLGIPSNPACGDPELAWQFVKWFSTEGSIYYANSGHLPTWKKADKSKLIDIIFGSEEEGEKFVDLEAYKRVVLPYENETFLETNITAMDKLPSTVNYWTMEILRGNIGIEEGFAEMKAEMDEEITEALAK